MGGVSMSLRSMLTPTTRSFAGLREGLPVAQGGADAFIGMLGLGVVSPGQMV